MFKTAYTLTLFSAKYLNTHRPIITQTFKFCMYVIYEVNEDSCVQTISGIHGRHYIGHRKEEFVLTIFANYMYNIWQC